MNCYSILQNFSTSVDFTEDNPVPTELKKGEAKLIVVEAFITSPMADLTLTVGQPLGYSVNCTVICKHQIKIC